MTDGGVIWITGLPGVGKTTVASLVRDRFASGGPLPVLLDGDRMRQAMPQAPGYTESERRRLAETYSGLAREFSTQGHLVVCSTVSLFHAVHAWNRTHMFRYLEVFLKAPIEELRRRGVRPALYGTNEGAGGHGRDVVGVGIPAELPVVPHLAVDMTTTDPDQAADLIVRTYTASATPAAAQARATSAATATATATATAGRPAARQEGAHGG